MKNEMTIEEWKNKYEMTREKAIWTIKFLRSDNIFMEYLKVGSDKEYYTRNIKSLDMAIKALEQEPSISDDGTLTVNVEDGSKVNRVLVCGELVCGDNRFRGLYYPEQEPKIGHWIGRDGHYICSCCKCDPLDFLEPEGLDGGSYMDTLMKYCPNCGAKMIEEE